MLDRKQVLLVDLQDLFDTRAEGLQVHALQSFLLHVLLIALVAWSTTCRAVDIALNVIVVWLVVLFVRELEC